VLAVHLGVVHLPVLVLLRLLHNTLQVKEQSIYQTDLAYSAVNPNQWHPLPQFLQKQSSFKHCPRPARVGYQYPCESRCMS